MEFTQPIADAVRNAIVRRAETHNGAAIDANAGVVSGGVVWFSGLWIQAFAGEGRGDK